MNTFLINLDRRKDRMIQAKDECMKAGISFDRFEAVDGRKHKPVSMRMSGGRLGCLLSHLRIVGFAKQERYPQVMILEDDVIFVDNFSKIFNERMKEVPEDWGIIYLGCNHFAEPVRVTENVSKVVKAYTTHAYIIRDTAYDIFIEKVSRKHHPVDVYLSEIQLEKNVYCFDPPLAWQRDGYSDVVGGVTRTKSAIQRKTNVR